MTPQIKSIGYLSKFTLAFLPQLGNLIIQLCALFYYFHLFDSWYNVDMSKGVEMTYGKGAGCGFLTKSCLSYGNYPFSFKEIDSSKAIRCNANREYAESVGIYRYGGLRPEQRYLKMVQKVAINMLICVPCGR